MIDPANHQIGLTVFQHMVFGKLHTVCRCAARFVSLYIIKNIILIQPQGLANGNGMPHARLGTIGGNDHHISQFFHDRYQYADSFGGDPIVIGN